MMDLLYDWYDDRYLSKVLLTTVLSLTHDRRVMVTDLER